MCYFFKFIKCPLKDALKVLNATTETFLDLCLLVFNYMLRILKCLIPNWLFLDSKIMEYNSGYSLKCFHDRTEVVFGVPNRKNRKKAIPLTAYAKHVLCLC